MTKKSQAVLEAHAKALSAEVRKLKRELKDQQDATTVYQRAALRANDELKAALVEVSRQRDLLIEKGVVELPEHALRAMDTKDGQPGVRADRFTKPAL